MDMEDVWVYGSFIVFFTLLSPIFLSLDGYGDIRQNRLFFSLHLFKFLKIFGGYITFHSDGFAVHISDKKAIFKKYGDLVNERNRFEIFDGFQLYTFRAALEIGDESFPAAAIYTTALAQIVSKIFFPLYQKDRVFMTLKNGIMLLHGDNAAKVTVHLVTVFNLLNDLPEDPEIEHTFYRNNKPVHVFKLSRIAGTCIAKNKTKGVVTIL
ncbi:MAG: hypothetical protein J6Z36_03405, partial [Clostridia bacterium]|nr:hypothetical protein [Clostridia bacterium]